MIRPRLSLPALSFVVAVLLVGTIPEAVRAQSPELPSLVAYRSRLVVEPQLQFRTIAQRCAALYRSLAAWTGGWDPDGASAMRRDAAVFEAAAVRGRVSAGSNRADAEAAVSAAVTTAERLYGDRVGNAPTAPQLAGDDFLASDLGVCRSMADIIGSD
ncbi:MAG: hypothetical protein HKO98_11600 [Gemmatimonadetes bacterium]|nr:hypothetical protein [Gemmatimonadota bacterium]